MNVDAASRMGLSSLASHGYNVGVNLGEIVVHNRSRMVEVALGFRADLVARRHIDPLDVALSGAYVVAPVADRLRLVVGGEMGGRLPGRTGWSQQSPLYQELHSRRRSHPRARSAQLMARLEKAQSLRGLERLLHGPPPADDADQLAKWH